MTRRITRKNSGLISNRPLTISAQYGLIDQRDFFKKAVASENIEGYYLLKRGEFAYNKSYSNEHPWGAVKRLDSYSEGVLSTLYICFESMGILSDWMVHYFDSSHWHKQVSEIAVEGARNHGLLNVSVEDFFNTYHYIPKTTIEQKKIATFLSLIDERITTQIGAIEKLKSLISSLNDKLQFQFCNEVNLSFSEIGNDYSGLSGKSANDFGRGKPYIPYTNIYANTFVDDSQFDLVEINEGEHQCRVLNGDVLFTLSSEVPEEVCVGSVYLGNEKELYLNSFCFGVHINSNKIHSPYLAYFVKSSIFRHTVYPLAQGSTRFNLQKSDFLKRKFSFPNIEHQIKIANVLMAIDSKLKIEQKLLEQYKLQKQYLLSQMFI